MSSHPVEALLRPAVEFSAAVAAFGCAALAVSAPEWLMMTPTVGQGSCVVLAGIGCWWTAGGVRVVRYRANLRRRRRYVMRRKDVPRRKDRLFLGRGFRWSEKHTQRLYDARSEKFAKFVRAGPVSQWVEDCVIGEPRRLATLGRLLGADLRCNPWRAPPPVGGLTMFHGVETKERDVTMPLRDRTGHMLVLGTTQVGKTRMLEVAVTQDIMRGEVVVVFDPKGDADLLRGVYSACEASKRLGQFRLFHLGYPELSSRYNGVADFGRATEVASRIANQVSGEGDSAVFREFVWRFVNAVARAMVALGETPDYESINNHVQNIDDLFMRYAEKKFEGDAAMLAKVADVKRRFAGAPVAKYMEGKSERLIAWERVLSEPGAGDEVLVGLRSAMRYERTYFDKLVASLLPLLEKLTTGKCAELLSPDYLADDDRRPIWDWREVVNQRGVVYVGLDALSDAPVAGAVGNSMFADLVSYAGGRYKHGDAPGIDMVAAGKQPPIVVHMDEFNELMGDEFIPLLNKGGAADVQVTAYTQTLSDIEAKIGDGAKARQVIGNFNSLVMFRVKDTDTAELLTTQLPKVNVVELMQIAGYTDSSDPGTDVDFSSKHEDRITATQTTMLEPHDLTKLPKGECFALLEGGVLYKARLPLPAGEKTSGDAGFRRLTADMEKRYRVAPSWADGSGVWVAAAGAGGSARLGASLGHTEGVEEGVTTSEKVAAEAIGAAARRSLDKAAARAGGVERRPRAAAPKTLRAMDG